VVSPIDRVRVGYVGGYGGDTYLPGGAARPVLMTVTDDCVIVEEQGRKMKFLFSIPISLMRLSRISPPHFREGGPSRPG
jgi:hypothetical protein